MPLKSEKDDKPEFILYGKRYLIAVMYSFDICVLSLMFPVFNPIAVELERIYKLD